jgi:heme/copper-type cytochrome/quinol oxidase subunit 2
MKHADIKKTTNKIHVLARISAFFITLAPVALFAQVTKFTNPISSSTLDGFVLKILDVVVTLGAVAVAFFIILAGFKYVTARGDEKKISSAHETLTWTIVGAAILLGAKVIASAIQATINQLNS